jgi:hypothetical protein
VWLGTTPNVEFMGRGGILAVKDGNKCPFGEAKKVYMQDHQQWSLPCPDYVISTRWGIAGAASVLLQLATLLFWEHVSGMTGQGCWRTRPEVVWLPLD